MKMESLVRGLPKNTSRMLPLIALLVFMAFLISVITSGSETSTMAALTTATFLPALCITTQLVLWQERMTSPEASSPYKSKNAGGLELTICLIVTVLANTATALWNSPTELHALIGFLTVIMATPMVSIWIHQKVYVKRTSAISPAT